jgi:hypothetical protein
MSYISNIEEGSLEDGLGCGPTCKCGPCRSGLGGFAERYEKEEVDMSPKVIVPRASTPRGQLHGRLHGLAEPQPRPEPMPTNPVIPRQYCPELNKIKNFMCYPYASREIAVSWSEVGHLTPDVVLFQPTLGPGMLNTIVSCKYLIIRDFGVDWRHLKDSTKNEQLLKDWLTRFETDNSLLFRIVGYSDCVGPERGNLFLRTGRAQNVFNLMGPRARKRVMTVAAAPDGTYLTDNSTVAGRASNRAVVIEILMNELQPA